MIQIYTGDGKGKTTAALGLILRMVGAGKKAALIQFMKKGKYSETKALRQFKNQIALFQFGERDFILKNKVSAADKKEAEKGLEVAEKILKSKKYDLVVLDEINMAVYFGLIKKEDIFNLLKEWGNKTEIVLTGRKAPKEFIKIADLVSEAEEIKHYYKKGIKARKGIDY